LGKSKKMNQKLKSLFGIILGAIIGSTLFLLFDTYIWNTINLTTDTPGFIFIVIILGALTYATGLPAGFLAVHIAKTINLRNTLLICFVTGLIFFFTTCYVKISWLSATYFNPLYFVIFPIYFPVVITTIIGGLIYYRIRKNKEKKELIKV